MFNDELERVQLSVFNYSYLWLAAAPSGKSLHNQVLQVKRLPVRHVDLSVPRPTRSRCGFLVLIFCIHNLQAFATETSSMHHPGLAGAICA